MPRPDNTDRNTRIIERLKAGLFAGDVAREMGLSKNVVIGVGNRAGLARTGRSGDGVRNAIAKGYFKPGHGVVRGEAHPRAILCDAAVRDIRRRYTPRCPVNGAMAMAREYGVHFNTVMQVISRRLWGHVQ